MLVNNFPIANKAINNAIKQKKSSCQKKQDANSFDIKKIYEYKYNSKLPSMLYFGNSFEKEDDSAKAIKIAKKYIEEANIKIENQDLFEIAKKLDFNPDDIIEIATEYSLRRIGRAFLLSKLLAYC